MKADLIIKNIGQLAACGGDGGAKRGDAMRDIRMIRDGALAILDGRFAAVGTSSEIEGAWTADSSIDCEGKAACPGFVDPHTHIVYAGDRLNEFELKIRGADYLEILANGGGILSTVQKTREASVEMLVEQALVRLDKMLRCGTTTAEIKTGYGLDIESELKMLRVIERLDEVHPIDLVPTFLPAHAVPPAYKGNVAGYVDLICNEMLPASWEWYEASSFRGKGTPFFVDVFCERNAFDLEQARRVMGAARGLGFGIKAHVDQFTNLGGSALAIEFGAASVDHLDAISDDEVAMLAQSETIGVVIPTENFSAGKTQFVNARKLIDEGCSVAISTDFNPGSAPCPSMSMAMAIACRYQKLSPAEALNAATVNAAYAIGMGASRGAIEAGKRADLLILDCEDPRQLSYEFGLPGVARVFIGGKEVSI